MTETQILQVFGLLFSAIGLGILFNLKFYENLFKNMLNSPAVTCFGGAIGLVVGYLVIVFHGTWANGWSLIITIMGWVVFIKGLVILILPGIQLKFSQFFLGKKSYIATEGVVSLILGIVFAYFGYFA